ncbi:MAG: 60S ribosomal protein L31 [Candidatus Micrarchaeota archaeon]|nr:60S ribosomal protein L31 [Candidatus Micrarchaeota archaeon]
MANLERIYTIPLGDAYLRARGVRAKRAIAFIRAFAARHMKAATVRISEGVNSLVFRDGMKKPPRRIKVRIVKGEDGLARVWLIGEEERLKQEAEKRKKEQEERQKQKEKAAQEAAKPPQESAAEKPPEQKPKSG